jgi:hypothetical protein
MKHWFPVLFCLLTGVAHAAPPTEVHASYRLLRNGQEIGTVTDSYRQEGKEYKLESETSAAGIFALFAKGKIRLTSAGEVTADGLRPAHFEHQRGADPAKTITADFDWDKQTVTHKFDGKTETAELKPGTQDRISMQYQFMFQPPRKGEILLPTTTGKRLNVYRYQVTGEEKVTVPAGAFRAMHLSKEHAADEDGTEIWLAKSRRYVPVRIVFEQEDGTKLEQQLVSVTFGPGKAR